MKIFPGNEKIYHFKFIKMKGFWSQDNIFVKKNIQK